MTALPEWVKQIADDCCVQQCETPLIEALAIAWEFIQKEQEGAHHVAADEVAERITKLGKE